MTKVTRAKPKVAIFHCGFIYSGGGERIVLEEAKGLKKRGFDVSVYAPTLDSEKCFPELIDEVGVETFFPSFIDWLPFRNGLRMVAASVLAPFLSYKFRDVDVFVGANQPGVWIAYSVAKVLGKPYIVYLNQPNRVVYPRPVDQKYGWSTTVKDYQILYKFFQILRPLISVLDRRSVKNAKEILVNGGYIGSIIENVYSKEVTLAPAGSYAYALSMLYTNPHTAFRGTVKIGKHRLKKPYALITNRHDPQKRFDYVIRAMTYVLKEFPDAKLVIPGPFTEHTKKLIKLAKKLGIEDNIFFLGSVSEKELQKLYRHCAVYSYPSPEEDFGLGPLEAGGWGVPTIAWNHAGPTVTVEDGVTGFLAEPFKVKDYAKKMIKLFKDQKLRAKMGKAAWERTKNIFSWDNHVDILEKSTLQII